MKALKIGSWLFLITVIFSVIYNSYFGWNELPESDAEVLCDEVYSVLFTVAIVIYLSPLIAIYELWVKKKLK